MYDALWGKRAITFLGLHSLSGADVTGSSAGQEKTTFWKTFIHADDDVLQALALLGKEERIPHETYRSLEKYICRVYSTAAKLSINQYRDTELIHAKICAFT